jgi:prepilin-type processing-associated H-X9-DG protein
MPQDRFQALAPRLSGCYAYALGYRENDGIEMYPHSAGTVPLMADAPPADVFTAGNSPNHGGRGQNILFTDGHAEFFTSRFLLNDDIFLNRRREVAPGLDPEDFVLGASATPLK